MTNKGLVYLVDQKTLEIDKKMRNNPTEKKTNAQKPNQTKNTDNSEKEKHYRWLITYFKDV